MVALGVFLVERIIVVGGVSRGGIGGVATGLGEVIVSVRGFATRTGERRYGDHGEMGRCLPGTGRGDVAGVGWNSKKSV